MGEKMKSDRNQTAQYEANMKGEKWPKKIQQFRNIR